MKSTVTRCWRCILSLAAAACVGTYAHAITVNVSGVDWPTTAEVITTPSLDVLGFNDSAGSSPFHLTQTFQTPAALDAESFFIVFGGDGSDPIDVGLTVFQVADVNAPSITGTPDVADILLDTTFTTTPEDNGTVMQIFLDSPLSLPASVGTAGYALRFTNEDDFSWRRTGSSGGNPYADGAAYENGSPKNNGQRDFALAVSSEGLPQLIDVTAVQSGDLNAASTWSNNAPPSAGSRYLIGSPFTVTANATSFDGGQVVVQSGGTLDFGVSEVVIDGDIFPGLVVDAGGALTNSATGDFAIGDITRPTLSRLELNGTANFTASPGADLFLDVDLSGTGDLNFESNGSGSDLFLSQAEGHTGVIRFNGTGDAVRLTEAEGFGTLEMNSTGANQVVYEGTDSAGGEDLIFNQPGTVVHSSVLDRLQTTGQLIANAPVAVDVSTTFPGNERRMFFGSGLDGASDINVTGTPTDPTSGSTTRNEFELGSSAEPSDAIAVDAFSGALTASQFVDVEVRRSMPDAAIVINNNATLEMGHEEIFTEFSVALGEVTVASGGTLVVGYERDGSHNPYLLTMTSDGTREGDLTLQAGSRTVMQVNGTAIEDYDQITSQGDVAIDGTLEILVNPTGFQSSFEQSNDIFINTYTPTLGDTFELIATVPDTLAGDYDGSGTVDTADYEVWKAAFGTGDAAADGNGDGAVDAADFTVWRDALGDTSPIGAITGTFSSLVVTDPGGVMSGAGLAFVLNYTATTVQLEVVAAGAATIPEPTTAALISAAFGALAVARRNRQR